MTLNDNIMDINDDSLILNIFHSNDSQTKRKAQKKVKKQFNKNEKTNEKVVNHRPDDDSRYQRPKDDTNEDIRFKSMPKPDRNRRPSDKKDRTPADRRSKRDNHFNSRLFDASSDQTLSFNLIDAKSMVEPVFSSHKYSELSLHPFLIKCLSDRLSISETTSVQQNSIPVLLEGSDALIKSMTGSGKTLAFAVPIIQDLQSKVPQITRSDGIHALVIVPTRELALQCYECFSVLCQSFKRLVTGYLCGGEKKKSEKARIRKGINILVTTPGRLIDHIQTTGNLNLRRVKWFVIDEADRLLEQGFEDSIKKVYDHLKNTCDYRPQTILLSATLTSAVQRLAGMSLKDPKVIDISDQNLDQIVLPENLSHHYIVVAPKLRLITLSALLMDKCSLSDSKALVFMSCQDVVDFHCVLFTNIFNKLLNRSNQKTIDFYQLHGNMDQSKRRQVFNEFRNAKNAVLFCTDVAARGLDLPQVDWIIQMSCAPKTEDFVHRVGRTARIGNAGNSVQFVLPTETKFLQLLQKDLNINISEIKMKNTIKTLMLFNYNRKVFTAEEYATQLQTVYENALANDEDLMGLAKRAYLSYIRAYVTYPKSISDCLPFKELHLGHLVKSFALLESPKALGAYGFRLKQQSIDLQQKYNKYNKRIHYNPEISRDNSGDNSDDETSGLPVAKRPRISKVPLEMRISEYGGPLVTKPSKMMKKRQKQKN